MRQPRNLKLSAQLASLISKILAKVNFIDFHSLYDLRCLMHTIDILDLRWILKKLQWLE